MTVQVQDTVFRYTANGVTTSFAYSCLVLADTDLVVTVDGVEVTTDFTITGIDSPTGGNVVFSVAPANLSSIILRRLVTLERATDYQQHGDWLADTVNEDFDRLWMADQQQAEQINRSIKFPVADSGTDAELPSALLRASKIWGFDADGNFALVIPADQSASALALLLAGSTGAAQIGFTAGTAGPTGATVEAALRNAAASGDIKLAPNFANSSAMVAQRTTAPNLSTSRQIGLCDNIGVWASGGVVGAGTISQITTAICGTTGYASRAAGVTLTGAGQISHSIRMEARDAVKYKNKTVSFSVKVDHDVGSSINYILVAKKATVADNFAATTTISTSSATSVTTATGTTLTFDGVSMGDCSNGIDLEVQAACGAVTTKNFNCTEFSIAVSATAPTYVAPDHEDELRRCRRYLPAFSSTAAASAIANGMCGSTTLAYCEFIFQVPPRVPPTGITTSTASQFSVWASSTAPIACTNIAFFAASLQACSLNPIVASGLVAGDCTRLFANSATATTILFTGCEL